MSDLKTNGTPIIEKIVLTTCLGDKVDVQELMVSTTIFEDMFAPCLTGFIEIIDAIGMFEQLPLSGNEKLTIKFKSWNYGDDNRVCDYFHRTFDILKISNITFKNDYTKTYQLHFASPELKMNETIKISKTYENASISSVISTIFSEDYNSDDEEPRGLSFPTLPMVDKNDSF